VKERFNFNALLDTLCFKAIKKSKKIILWEERKGLTEKKVGEIIEEIKKELRQY
jgi:site-specific DNA-cytosine methylase